MLDLERLSDAIMWIDISFMEHEQTPNWVIQVGIRCHLSGMPFRDTRQSINELGVQRSHVAIHNWIHNAELQPMLTVTADQLTVDKNMICLHGQELWLYGTVNPEANEILQLNLFPTANKQTKRQFWPDLIVAIRSTTCCFSSMTLTILVQFLLKTATDFEPLHMEIGMLLNVSSGK